MTTRTRLTILFMLSLMLNGWRHNAIPGVRLHTSRLLAAPAQVVKPPAPFAQHSPIEWRRLEEGLWFTQVDALAKGRKVNRVALVKVDPNRYRLRVFHDLKVKTIEEWQAATGATVMFNSSYYGDDYQPVGLILVDGTPKGPKRNKAMKGMLVAEPKDGSTPRATIIPLTAHGYDLNHSPWTQGVQSFPMLLDPDGRIGVKRSNWRANRTVIATDRKGHLLIFTTEGGFFTLYGFAQFLRHSDFDIAYALNLDGGYEAEMCVKTKDFFYVTYGQWETNDTGDISIPGIRIKIPAVIGVFPRSQ